MMINPIAISIRSKKLGVLIRDARLSHNKTVNDCATAIGVSPERFEDYELGEAISIVTRGRIAGVLSQHAI